MSSSAVCGCQDQLGIRIGEDNAFQERDEPIVHLAMEEPEPRRDSVPRDSQVLAKAANQLRKNDVHGDGIRIKTVDSGAEDQVITTLSKTVPTPGEVVGREPPEEVKQVRPR